MIRSAMKWAFRDGVLASSAFAAQNVANTSQKGSLLISPLIDQRPGGATIIRIANDANVQVRKFRKLRNGRDAVARDVYMSGGSSARASVSPVSANICRPYVTRMRCPKLVRGGWS